MKTTTNLREQISPNNMTSAIELVLNCLGDIVITTVCDEDNIDYDFPNKLESLLILGDNAWGTVTGASVKNGHLVLIANFGNDGDYSFSLTDRKNQNGISLSEICVATKLESLHEPKLPPLIEKHFRELQFDLRLKFKKPVKVDGKILPVAYVGRDGPVRRAKDAIYFTSGPVGEDVPFLLKWFSEENSMHWLQEDNIQADDLELVSELSEM